MGRGGRRTIEFRWSPELTQELLDEVKTALTSNPPLNRKDLSARAATILGERHPDVRPYLTRERVSGKISVLRTNGGKIGKPKKAEPKPAEGNGHLDSMIEQVIESGTIATMQKLSARLDHLETALAQLDQMFRKLVKGLGGIE